VAPEKTAATPAPVQQATEPKEQASTGGWQMPVDSVHISSRFGYRTDPTGASGNQHNGIDFTGGTGTPIYAIQAGEVVEAGYGPSTGNYVIIKHANGIYSYYMHFSTLPAVSVGQSVSARQYVGGMGTTGNSTGVHLHLGMSTSLWSGFFDPAPELGL
jgi:murein DD-endopeptidase MepM/ murein hydrolase activator NlpD